MSNIAGYTVLLKVSKARKVPKAVQTLMDLFPGTTLKVSPIRPLFDVTC